MTSADIEEELVADGIAAIFTTDEGVEQFAEYVAKKSEPEKKSIVQAFKKLVAHIVDTIKKALSRGNLTQYQKEYLEMEKDQAEHIRTLFLDSLDKASENYKSEQKNNTTDSGVNTGTVKSSLDIRKARELDIAWDNDNFSSIRTQMRNHLQEINEMKPVTSVSVIDFRKSTIEKELLNILKNRFGYKIDTQNYGSFLFDEKAVNDVIGYLKTNAEGAAVLASPYVIKRGKVVSGHKNHKLKGNVSLLFAAPAELNGQIGNIGVAVLIGNKNRVHSVRVLTPQGNEFEIIKNNDTEPLTSVGSTTKSGVSTTIGSVSNNRLTRNKKNVKNSFTVDSDYSYEMLTSKPDMPVTVIDDRETYIPNKKTRSYIINEAIERAKKFGKVNENGNAVVHVKDIKTDIIVPKTAMQHSLDRRLNVNSHIVLNLGNILKNSIKINELVPRFDNIEKSYVLVGIAKNYQNEPYVVTFVVNKFTNELTSIDVMYSVNAKTEPAGSLSPQVSTPATGSTISISDLLDYVNNYYPDILSKDVLKHYGYKSRPEGKLGESALYSKEVTHKILCKK